jgi:U3 small nucleolar RNA-associated protein 13
VSIVRGLAFCDDFLFTGARDKVIIKWNHKTGEQLQTIPIHEQIESLKVIKTASDHQLISAGEKGVLKTWSVKSGKLIQKQSNDSITKEEMAQPIISLEICESTLVAITGDQNIQFYDLKNLDGFKMTKQIAGYNEEVLDLALLGNDSHLAVITNTNQIRVYDLSNNDCDIVYGHEDIVMCVDSSFDKSQIITGSKDHTAKVWDLNLNGPIGERVVLRDTLKGHTGAVTAVATTKMSNEFILTASQDRTIKCWAMGDKLESRYTIHAHDKDIQSIDISPNDQYFVSCSLDKTIKMFDIKQGTLLGTFKGHKRGVWAAKFSPVDQVIASCSTDKTIKLWNIRDYSCVKTFEGHLNTVLDLSFLSMGMQLMSVGSDGLMKLWTIKTGELVNTFDNHEDRVFQTN